MTALRYLCLSDLHLGAGNSVLTSSSGGKPDPTKPSRTLQALAAGLARLVPMLAPDKPPTLVLMGDVLDLGLSPMGDVIEAFRRFVEQVMLPGGKPLFAPDVLVVPGNHDHHLWRMAQDHALQRALLSGRVPRDLVPCSPLLGDGDETTDGHIPSPMIEAVLGLYPALGPAKAHTVYPNLGLVTPNRERCVVLHHGHYVDGTYRLMSTFNALFTPDRTAPLTVDELEQQNGPWVDFLWSDLGSAGATGQVINTLYEVLRDAGASQQYLGYLGDLLLRQLSQRFGISGRMKLSDSVPFTVEQLLRAALDATVGKGAATQRDSYLDLIGPGEVDDLRWYLEGPVMLQLQQAGLELGAIDLGFVYGHTHKPLQDELPLSAGRPVDVFNTGGWVMDQPTMTSTQGAAAVLIDDELNIASLRLFTDPLNGEMTPVHAAGTGGVRDLRNPMLQQLRDALKDCAPEWAEFTQRVQVSTEHRADNLLRQFFDTPVRETE